MGPPSLVQGGYAAGTLAAYIDGAAKVVLKNATPVEKTLSISNTTGRYSLWNNDNLLAEASPMASSDLASVPDLCSSCSFDHANRAKLNGTEEYAEIHYSCFCCLSGEDDLRLGVALGQRSDAPAGWLAGTWVPPNYCGDRKNLDVPTIWAALDCAGWYVWHHKERFPAALLGTMCGEVNELPPLGEPLILCAWPIEGGTGRKRFSGTAMFDLNGKCLARMQQVWLAIKV